MSAKAIILGRVGFVKHVDLANNLKKVEISIATDSRKKSEDKKTNWHSVSFFGNDAVNIEKYVEKGDMIQVEGHIEYETWQDADGNPRNKTIILGSSYSLIGRVSRNEEKDKFSGNLPKKLKQNKSEKTIEVLDDDIPF